MVPAMRRPRRATYSILPNALPFLGFTKGIDMRKNNRGVRTIGTGKRKGMRTSGVGYIGGTMHSTRHEWAAIRNRILERDAHTCREGA